MACLSQNISKKREGTPFVNQVKKCDLFSRLASSNFALALFICLQHSIILASCCQKVWFLDGAFTAATRVKFR